MACTAKISLGDFSHVHRIGPLGHLENLVMTARAREALPVHVFFVAENDRGGVLRRKHQITAADLLRRSTERIQEPAGDHDRNEQAFHILPGLT